MHRHVTKNSIDKTGYPHHRFVGLFALLLLAMSLTLSEGHGQEPRVKGVIIEPVTVAKRSEPKPLLTVDSMVRPSSDLSSVFARLKTDRSFVESGSPETGNRSSFDSNLDREILDQPDWSQLSYCWETPVFSHRPLYFEQPNLERYGSRNPNYVTPLLSAGHFYGSLFLMPWQMVREHPCDCRSTLGNRRPGNCNPLQRR
jgi:hypothetical protein